jgi:hypothetical protein
MQAECLFMMGSLEKSLRYWHKAAKLRPNQEEVFTVTFFHARWQEIWFNLTRQ